MNNINSSRNKEKIAFALLWGFSVMTIIILVLILANIIINGISHISLDFLLEEPRKMGKAGGIFSVIVSTFYIVALSIVFAAPLGVGASVYLTEYAKEGIMLKIIRFGTESLAGIPSIIYGLFGYSFFVVYLNLKYSILSGALTLTLMILPTIVRTSEEAIKAVPKSYREGSLALGATKLQTIRKIIIPTAMPGILTGLILGVGRVIGESAAVIYTAGSSLGIPDSIFRPGRTLSVHLYTLASEGLSRENTYATAVVLIILVFIINFVANRLIKNIFIAKRR
ncbi:phosphate ABC transporter permease PstA [Lutispora sp.]|uniref:phosphate ABC transporter permease PstA n=1 Tax=Lutispora sp. TaxID=2828727 RepID=UPI000EDF14A7|nr:phosphate ABC transporter permease PstA [Lutispora sp.]MEA4962011.1 phosphate ABC transporter permease PstA [Lutispora sp.]HCJ58047.1 phosphate ABC transporter permease PtsA [Clostridiaceae bacterium]